MKVARAAWRPDDAPELADAVIVGRAVVDVDGGGRYHALVVDVGVYEPILRAVYWQRTDDGEGRFVTVDV